VMKFRKYSYARKSVELFLNRIQETFGQNLLIGYGDWSTPNQLKHTMPTLNKGLRKSIDKRFNTVSIDEYNTSKKCSVCRQDLDNAKDKAGKAIHRLLFCPTCRVYKTRDKNSATNMLNLTLSWIRDQKRPAEFQRSPTETKRKVK